jgi:hypothetical protein
MCQPQPGSNASVNCRQPRAQPAQRQGVRTRARTRAKGTTEQPVLRAKHEPHLPLRTRVLAVATGRQGAFLKRVSAHSRTVAPFS